jgi:hypothetical protein
MLAVSVDLGTIKVAGKTPNLSLTLSSSVTIALPSSWSETPTAEELCHASSTGRIWISKAGSCQVDMSSLVNNEVLNPASFDPSIVAAIANFLPECSVCVPRLGDVNSLTSQIWQHTGLQLRTNHAFAARQDHSHAQASYFLHHPDLSSQMITPPDVPWAQFQGLRCKVNYHFKSAKREARNKLQSFERATSVTPSPIRHAQKRPPRHAYGLRSNPKRSAKAALAQEDINDAVPSLSATSSPMCELSHNEDEPEDLESLASRAIAEMACLLDFAFRKLVGIKGTWPGMKTVKRMDSPSLIDIAPAVWDLQYLQVSLHIQVYLSVAYHGYRQCLHTPKSYRQSLSGLLVSATPGLRAFERSWTS